MAQPATGGPVIRTPDQLLRVFVSSTLGELAPERRAARAAIERLRLAPVMFELGARPHPPRKLYRSYLEQSDVFVGIYWERYGWIAPGEEISGLEDEYRLADPRMPKLIYLKASNAREERLAGLITQIQRDDTASYLTFHTEDELRDHLVRDLATLLAERFQAGTEPPAAVPEVEPGESAVYDQVPAPYTPIVGRGREIDDLTELLDNHKARVVTLVGTGGIGKSRLAIEVALRAGPRFADGVVFVHLENVVDPKLLLPTIAQALGIGESGEASIEERLPIALAQRRVLIVLDNFEQLVDAAPALVGLYSNAPDATFLVTSRAVLRIRGELVYELGGLSLPGGSLVEPHDPTLADAGRSEAVQLFVDRAQAVHGGFELTTDNVAAVVRICQELEGSPLAIELAAARVRALTPQAILQRLDRPLALLASAARDVPARQRTLQATIEWSCNLLTAEQRDLLADLSVFAPGFTDEAVEALGASRPWAGRELEGLAALIDNSLLRQHGRSGVPLFSMPATVRQYAESLLTQRGELGRLKTAHARYYTALAAELGPVLRGPGQVETAERLQLELPNLRTAVGYSVELGRPDDAADLAWSLLVFWWFGGYFGQVRVWMEELLARQASAAGEHTLAVANFLIDWVDMWLHPSPAVAAVFDEARRRFANTGDVSGEALATACAAFTRISLPGADADACRADLTRAVDLFEGVGDSWGAALALVGLGRVESIQGDEERAAESYLRAGRVAREHSDTLATLITDHHIGRVQLFGGRLEEAEDTFGASVRLSSSLGLDGGVADGLEGLSAIAAARDQVERAALLSGAAAALRQRLGFYEVPAFVFHERYLDTARALDPDAFAAAQARGRELTAEEAVALALTPESASSPLPEEPARDEPASSASPEEPARDEPASSASPEEPARDEPASRRAQPAPRRAARHAISA
jgi:predicted ATPase